MLAVERVSKSLGGMTVLQDVSFTVAQGVLFGLVGANGSGKTTMLDIIGGQRSADAGDVLLQEKSLSRLSVSQRAAIGVARTFQESRLWRDLTIAQHLAVLPAFGRESRASSQQQEAPAIFDLVELPSEFVGRYPQQLALIERRRVELALAAAARPNVLLVDEIGAGLDTPEARALYRIIAQLVAGGHVAAAVLVEHKLDILAEVATEIVLLENGRIRERALSHRPAEVSRLFARLLTGPCGRAGKYLAKEDRLS